MQARGGSPVADAVDVAEVLPAFASLCKSGLTNLLPEDSPLRPPSLLGASDPPPPDFWGSCPGPPSSLDVAIHPRLERAEQAGCGIADDGEKTPTGIRSALMQEEVAVLESGPVQFSSQLGSGN